ncbi:SDR family NAD(P)-dependent oxidoreductase [Micromonospora sp. DT53]|uniref:SDR family NAD(P)-dependent oxidoreductase n=1 Tax=Micromonospora sp. DT53 TaxID=3393444 RepID=UPI003CFBC0AD
MNVSKDGTAPRAVVVTGGGTGIGQATARAFAEHADHVLVVGRTERTLVETADGYPTIRPLTADITAPGQVRHIVDTAVREFGRIDVLVNNASAATPAPLGTIEQPAALADIEVNLLAPILLTQAAIPALAATGGTVVNISSAGSLGRRAWPNFSIYGATKVGLDFLTRTWAVELAPQGIRVVGIAPGVVETGMGVRSGATQEEYARFLEWMKTVTPLGRVGAPAEIAWWVRQLTAPEAGFATGTVLAVDGGASVV